MTETRAHPGTTRAAWMVAAGLAFAFALLLWPSSADAQRALRPKCEPPMRTLNVATTPGLGATFTGVEPLLNCASQATPTSFNVRQTCTFHCQHWHTWVPTGTPKVANVRLTAHPAAGAYLVDWSDNCTSRFGQGRGECTVPVSTNPTTVTAVLSTTQDTQAPTQPGAVPASPQSYAAVIRWAQSSDNVRVAGYDVFRGDTLAARAGRNATSVTVQNLSCLTTYTFRVEAFDASANATPSAPITVTTGKCGVTQKPNTAIHVKPSKRTKQRSAFFHFGQKGSIQATKFQCKLDKRRWAACSGKNGKRYRGLKKGIHTFQVRAGNRNGWDPTPAKHRWRIA